MREVFERNIESGEELGAAIAINVDGETVVDLWGGYQDPEKTTPWQQDTIVNVWSTSKEISALAVLMCVDRGLLDVREPVATYWPEFAQNGKEAVEVRHLLSHTSGVSGWDAPFVTEDMYDREAATARLAAQAPWWEPGTASGYHAQNQGHLLGELVRRATGSTLTEFVRNEIAGPLAADLQVGAAEEDEPRIAEIVPPPFRTLDLSALPQDLPMVKTLGGPMTDPSSANTTAWRRAELGGFNVHTNARALARVMSAVACDGIVDGVKLLSPQTIDLIFEEQSNGVDLVLGEDLRFGIGFGLPQPKTLPYVPDGRTCFWGGWGGSMTVMFTDSRTTVSYVMNRMAPGVLGSDRSEAYLRAIVPVLA